MPVMEKLFYSWVPVFPSEEKQEYLVQYTEREKRAEIPFYSFRGTKYIRLWYNKSIFKAFSGRMAIHAMIEL